MDQPNGKISSGISILWIVKRHSRVEQELDKKVIRPLHKCYSLIVGCIKKSGPSTKGGTTRYLALGLGTLGGPMNDPSCIFFLFAYFNKLRDPYDAFLSCAPASLLTVLQKMAIIIEKCGPTTPYLPTLNKL